MIACQNLTRSYRGVLAVKNVSLEIGPGINCLLGANGAGKSTLLKLLTGLLTPDSGDIQIAGMSFTHPIQIKSCIGVLPEELGLFEDLTIYEHLQLMGPIYSLSRRETERRAADLLRLLALTEARNRFLRQCSYGMRKKTALAMALLHNPRVLFLDEPFEGIDPASSRVIEALLTSLSERGVTILLTSHILPPIERLASRSLILQQGMVIWDSADAPLQTSIEQKYFELVGLPLVEEMPWLGS